MKFVEAMRYLLDGKRITNPRITNSEYLYINMEDKIVNELGYGVSIDVNNDEWELYEKWRNG